MKRVFLRGLAVLLLAVSTFPAAYAAQKPVPRDRPGLLAAAWTWIVLHAFPVRPPAWMEKEGCDIDPDGGKVVCAPAVLNDAGCDIDPNG